MRIIVFQATNAFQRTKSTLTSIPERNLIISSSEEQREVASTHFHTRGEGYAEYSGKEEWEEGREKKKTQKLVV